MSLENDIDVFDMDDDQFTSQFGTFESGSLVHVEEESIEKVDSTNTDLEESDEYIDVPEEEDEYEVDTDSEELSEVSDEVDSDIDTDSTKSEDTSDAKPDTNEFDYKSEYSKLIGTPIKGAGKEVTLKSVDDAIRLVQMGMGYHKTMEQMKPHKRVIAMLEKNDMLDEEKLSYAIDLINKNPQAISKLVQDADFTSYDVDEEQANQYKPTNHKVSDEDIAINSALNDISSTPTYSRTVNVIGREWDNASRDIVRKNPEVISVINDHIASGLFETVSNEVESFKMLGKLPAGMSDLEAYKYVGDALYAQSQAQQTAPNMGQQQEFEQANVKPPIKKPNRETVIRQKRATNVPRSQNTRKRMTAEDVFNMDDEAFLKQYGNGNSQYF